MQKQGHQFKIQVVSGVATHWILWINPGAARCWRAAKCDNVSNEQRQSH